MNRHPPKDRKAQEGSDALDRIERVLADAAKIRDYIASIHIDDDGEDG